MPPPAESLVSRVLVGPALRTQPDRRLVTLVGQGYEAAFEEIVRRYRKPLGRYAEAIVGGRSEDVTQEAFSKALQALRRSDGEIDLRPWLYRIVRNTALNDLRDRPAAAEELADAIAGGRTPTEIVEGRERLTDLIRRLRSLPEAQRAAIVMRELEGLGHDEIGSALGLSGGAARQAIYRARQALRDGLGVLVPLPLTRSLLEDIGAGSAETTAGVANAGGAAGAGVALKAAAATIMVAGAVGAGIAIERPPGDGELRSTVGVDRAIAGGPDGIAPKEGAAPRKDSGDGNTAGGRRGPGDMRGDGSRGRSRGRGPRGADHRHGPGGGQRPTGESAEGGGVEREPAPVGESGSRRVAPAESEDDHGDIELDEDELENHEGGEHRQDTGLEQPEDGSGEEPEQPAEASEQDGVEHSETMEERRDEQGEAEESRPVVVDPSSEQTDG